MALAPPGFRAFSGYRRPWLVTDLVAGVVLTTLLVPQGRRPVETAPRRSHARPLPGQPDPQHTGTVRAPHRGCQPHRLTVDADRHLGGVGGHDHLRRFRQSQPLPVRAVQETDGLPGGVHADGDHAEQPSVQRCIAGHPRPMYGIVVASTVMFATFASSGRPAM
jgi:hypothetical protein